jgi:hypothetical protein
VDLDHVIEEPTSRTPTGHNRGSASHARRMTLISALKTPQGHSKGQGPESGYTPFVAGSRLQAGSRGPTAVCGCEVDGRSRDAGPVRPWIVSGDVPKGPPGYEHDLSLA